MFISIAQDNVNFKPIEVKTFDKLLKIICSDKIKAYSFSTYKNNYRNKQNFLNMRCIGLDIDNDKSSKQLSLEEAKVIFKDYKHVIATTRSHQKEKNGLIVDRFRVVLFFNRDVTIADEFTRTWYLLKSKFPVIDAACKDESRYWFPSQSIESVNQNGICIDIPEKQQEETKVKEKKEITNSTQGKLSYNTMKFFTFGAEPGERNSVLFKVALDCNEQGYDIDYVKDKVKAMIDTTGNWATDHLNNKDIEAISNAFKRDPKYDKREDEIEDDEDDLKSNPYNFIHIKETINDKDIKTEWLIDELLAVGGFSLKAGQPKSGKSTIMRQLAICVAEGKEYLGREVKQGTVYYLALEDMASQVKEQFIKQKVNPESPIYIHYGTCDGNMEYLEQSIVSGNVKLLMIDTMALFLNAENLNDYSILNKLLLKLRDMARRTNCHVTMIHHQTKSTDGGTLSIMGSNAIHGAVDNAMMFEKLGKSRFITTSQRGGVPFMDTKLAFNTQTQTYKLAKKQTKKYDDDDEY